MGTKIPDTQKELFQKVWKALYGTGEKEDRQVQEIINRMHTVVTEAEWDEEKVWDRIQDRIVKQQHTRRKLWHKVVRYAAVIILPLLCALTVYLFNGYEKPKQSVATLYVRPNNAVTLTLASGEKMEIDNEKSGEFWRSEAVSIRKDSVKGLFYEAKRSADMRLMRYNTLEVPVAADYRLQLSDGTIVYLNSDSRLKYPEVFIGKERKVYLEGEAFFEVAKDPEHPFQVVVKELEIKVLGTHFNVNAYPENREIVTTLAEGKINVKDRMHQVVLVPGEQAIVSTDGLQVKEVDVRHFISWKDGLFVFSGMTLEEIMVQVYRWYGIRAVFLNDEVRTATFTGVINKNMPANDFFRVIEKVMDVRFTMDKDNQVVIAAK